MILVSSKLIPGFCDNDYKNPSACSRLTFWVFSCGSDCSEGFVYGCYCDSADRSSMIVNPSFPACNHNLSCLIPPPPHIADLPRDQAWTTRHFILGLHYFVFAVLCSFCNSTSLLSALRAYGETQGTNVTSLRLCSCGSSCTAGLLFGCYCDDATNRSSTKQDTF